jgi:hypothetical protein
VKIAKKSPLLKWLLIKIVYEHLKEPNSATET